MQGVIFAKGVRCILAEGVVAGKLIDSYYYLVDAKAGNFDNLQRSVMSGHDLTSSSTVAIQSLRPLRLGSGLSRSGLTRHLSTSR